MLGNSIDMHGHCMPEAYKSALQSSPIAATVRIPTWSIDAHYRLMDEHKIEKTLLSLAPPGIYFGNREVTRQTARACNEEMASLVRKSGGRFDALAVVPLPNAEDACDEIAYALDELGFAGVSLFTSYDGVHLGSPAFDAAFDALDARSAITLIHPNVHPMNQHIHLDWPAFLLEYPFETTRAAINLIFSKTLDRCPNIKFILSHGGGALSVLAYRISIVGAEQLAKPPYVDKFPVPLLAEGRDSITPELLIGLIKRFRVEVALSAGAATLSALKTLVGVDNMLFGTDWPYAPETILRDMRQRIVSEGVLTAEEQTKVATLNAAALLGKP